MQKTAITKRWFSGAYTYHLPTGYYAHQAVKGSIAKANDLLGLELTPEVLWNISPWTWLFDWAANIGDVVANATALQSDNLVIRYGYIMAQTSATNTYQLDGPSFYAGGPGVLTAALGTILKQRVRATPFGFGLTTDAFTGRQWAILASLGITRGNSQSLLGD